MSSLVPFIDRLHAKCWCCLIWKEPASQINEIRHHEKTEKQYHLTSLFFLDSKPSMNTYPEIGHLARLETSSQSVSDVLTSELLKEGPYKSSNAYRKTYKKGSGGPNPAHERLEVQTDSSQLSLPVSFSYYQYSAYGGLDGVISERAPPPVEKEPSPAPKSASQTPPRSVQLKKGKIVQNPRFSLRSGPLHQVPVMVPQKPRKNGNSASNSASSIYSVHRDISNSMGSQATIFSVREDQLSTKSKTRLRNRGMLRRRPTKAGTDYGRDSSSGLFRRKAVRSKDGSFGYRLRLRLRKMAAKLRAMKNWPKRVYAFATKKKATQRATMEKSARLLRSRNNSKLPMISAPLKNPYLGRELGASRVEGLTDDLKNMAGHGTLDNSGAAIPPKEAAIPPKVSDEAKWSQLSRYISEQQELSIPQAKPYESSAAFDSEAPPPPPHTVSASLEKQRIQGLWKQYLVGVLTQRIQLRQEIAMFQALVAGQSVPSVLKGTPEVALSYNASIVKGDSDRGTTSSHYDDFVPKSGEIERNVYAETIEDDDDDAVSFVSVSDSILSDNDAVSLPDEVTDWEEEDPAVAKLNRSLNRRSVLGDMLNYDSDDASLGSGSSVYLNLNSQSVTESAIFKRYGTLRRKRSTATNTPKRESSIVAKATMPAPATPPPATPPPATPPLNALEDISDSSIPRSTGIHRDLHIASNFD